MTASINVEVVKGPNENNISVLRRFTRRVQSAGILPRVRSIRYSDRNRSENVQKAKTLKVLKKKEEIAELVKLGKIRETSKFTRRRR